MAEEGSKVPVGEGACVVLNNMGSHGSLGFVFNMKVVFPPF